MTRRCVIERWVQRKTDQKLIFYGNYTQIVFFVFRIHFHYVLSYLVWFIWSKNMCKHTLTHIIAKKCNFAWKNSEKIAKNHDFGDFWWFSCFWNDVTYDVTVASYKVCLYFFRYQWTREGHSYPLVPHSWYSSIGFRDLRVGGICPPPRLWDGSKKPGFLGLKDHVNKIPNYGYFKLMWTAVLIFTSRHPVRAARCTHLCACITSHFILHHFHRLIISFNCRILSALCSLCYILFFHFSGSTETKSN